MFRSLEEQLTASNCDILFSSSNHDPEKEIEILRGLVHADVDAVVLYSTGHPHSQALVRRLLLGGKPVVLLDRYVQNQAESLSWVTSENEQGAYELTWHLVTLGHERICMSILTPEHQHERVSTLVEREHGYQKAMVDAGLEVLVMKECCVMEETSESYGRELLRYIEREQPTAIFFHNDVSAYRMHAVLTRSGIRIPQDISIAGFDGLDLFNDLLAFDLTTVAQDFSGLGRETGQLVLSLLENPGQESKRIRVPVKLHLGNTTAAPRLATNRLQPAMQEDDGVR